jgi:hypothetical protein
MHIHKYIGLIAIETGLLSERSFPGQPGALFERYSYMPIHIFMYLWAYICAYVHTYIHVYICIHAYIYIQICIYMKIRIYLSIKHLRIFKYVFIDILHVYMYIHYIYTYIVLCGCLIYIKTRISCTYIKIHKYYRLDSRTQRKDAIVCIYLYIHMFTYLYIYMHLYVMYMHIYVSISIYILNDICKYTYIQVRFPYTE